MHTLSSACKFDLALSDHHEFGVKVGRVRSLGRAGDAPLRRPRNALHA
jgi:hypothetical protein